MGSRFVVEEIDVASGWEPVVETSVLTVVLASSASSAELTGSTVVVVSADKVESVVFAVADATVEIVGLSVALARDS